MERVLAHVRGGKVLKKYDFVDVMSSNERTGWQVKSTKENTPVTWKRAKIPNAGKLIKASHKSPIGRQKLGNAIIDFCNQHVINSLQKYDLTEIGYCRLIIHDSGEVTYFERRLCTRSHPRLFDPTEFEWKWSKQKKTKKKEQLPALHGYHKAIGQKWWAWHGKGENQLHFSGERNWWPHGGDNHAITFRLPDKDERIPFDKLKAVLSALES